MAKRYRVEFDVHISSTVDECDLRDSLAERVRDGDMTVPEAVVRELESKIHGHMSEDFDVKCIASSITEVKEERPPMARRHKVEFDSEDLSIVADALRTYQRFYSDSRSEAGIDKWNRIESLRLRVYEASKEDKDGE